MGVGIIIVAVGTALGFFGCGSEGFRPIPGTGKRDGGPEEPDEDGSVGGSPSIQSLILGSFHTCALFDNGRVKCWGVNGAGELGLGTFDKGPHPEPAWVPELESVTQISTNGNHNCARLIDGTAMCWGWNYDGQIGDGTIAKRSIHGGRSSPVPVLGLENITQIGAGGHFTCALVDGSVWCWGNNWSNQLGDGTRVPHSLPQLVPNLSGVEQIKVGGAHTYALTRSTILAWGSNYYGQIGDGTMENYPSPTPVPKLEGMDIAQGGELSCGLQDGAAWCWGYNSSGGVGDGTTGLGRSSPTPVLGLVDVVQIAPNTYHACALLEDTTVWCWGNNKYGQLGDGTREERHLPTQVLGLADVKQIVSGVWHSCALLNDGAVMCWGSNNRGQLGDGTTEDRTSPTPVIF